MRRHRGSAMVWVLVLAILLGSGSAVLVERALTTRRDVAGAIEAEQAFYAAEGGLAETRLALASDPDHPGARYRIGGCDVRTEISEVEGGWAVSVVATPGGGRIRADLKANGRLPDLVRWARVP